MLEVEHQKLYNLGGKQTHVFSVDNPKFRSNSTFEEAIKKFDNHWKRVDALKPAEKDAIPEAETRARAQADHVRARIAADLPTLRGSNDGAVPKFSASDEYPDWFNMFSFVPGAFPEAQNGSNEAEIDDDGDTNMGGTDDQSDQ